MWLDFISYIIWMDCNEELGVDMLVMIDLCGFCIVGISCVVVVSVILMMMGDVD